MYILLADKIQQHSCSMTLQLQYRIYIQNMYIYYVSNAIVFWQIIVNNAVNFNLLMNANYGLFVILSKIYYSPVSIIHIEMKEICCCRNKNYVHLKRKSLLHILQ